MMRMKRNRGLLFIVFIVMVIVIVGCLNVGNFILGSIFLNGLEGKIDLGV